jgi:hypothetical protein
MTPDTLPSLDRAEWARAAADQLDPEPEMSRAGAERDAYELGDWLGDRQRRYGGAAWTGKTTDLGDLGEKPGPDDCAPCWRKAKAAKPEGGAS